LKDDLRYDFVERYLRDAGHNFLADNTSSEGLDFAIFPFLGEVNTSVYDDGFFGGMRRGTPVFSGVRSDYLARLCEAHGLEYHAMIEDKAVAIKNAIPTSEGVLAYLLMNRKQTLEGSRALVIGYGICGRDLADRLRGLGVRVSALVRNREKAAMAAADGVKPIYLNQLPERPFDIIINTVPQKVLTNEMLDITAGALLIDIASAPYGFDMEHAKRLNSKSTLLPGIPGKNAPQTAGEILGEYIDFVLQKGRGGDDAGR